MIYNFDEIIDRRSTESDKWSRFPADVLPMWVADMDFRSPEPVVQALRERAAHGVFGYVGEMPDLRQTIIERMDRLYGWQVLPEEILFLPGVVSGIQMAANGLAGPGGGVLIQTPVYMPFLDIAHYAGGIAQEMELTRNADGSYCIDWDAFEAAITPQTRMFLLCNPHNPVGRVFTRQELERMVEICQRHGVIICSDEIHCDLIYPGHRHIPMATLSPDAARSTVTLMAPSKTFNIAGLSCAFAIIQNPELRRTFAREKRGMLHGSNLLGLVAAQAAYTEGQEWLDQVLAYLEGNCDTLFEFVRDQMPGVKMFRPQGTYLAWLDCTEAGLAQRPGAFFLEKARVALSYGESFGRGGKGFVRLNFGCPRPLLTEGLERMRRALVER